MDRKMYRRRFALFPLFGLIAVFLLGAVVKYLWNAILPSITEANPITYWQSVGLLLLCRILCGNFGPRGGGKPGWADWKNKMSHEKRAAWRSKWMKMSAEERLKFRQEMRKRCGKPPGRDRE